MTGFCDTVHVFGIAGFLEPYSCAGFVLGLEWMNKECALFKGPKSLLGNIHFSAVMLSLCGGRCLPKRGCPFVWKAAIIWIVLVCSTLLFFFLGFAERFQVSSAQYHVSSQASRRSLFLPCGWKSCHFFYDLQPSHFCDLLFCFMNKSHIFLCNFFEGVI